MVWRQGRRARTVVRCGCPATQGRELVSGEAPVPYVTDAGTFGGSLWRRGNDEY